jgi:hypothetical protein
MVFVAAVTGPVALAAMTVAMRVSGRGTSWLGAVLGVTLAVGAYLLTDSQRFEVFSDGLRLGTRVSMVPHVAVLALVVVTYEINDWLGWRFFMKATTFTTKVAEALLALVAARNLSEAGWKVAASAARWLAVATLTAIVAGQALTHPTHDDMFNLVPSRYAYLILPLSIALWLGKLAVFGALLRAKRPPGAAAP